MGSGPRNRSTLHVLLLVVLVRGHCLLRGCSLERNEHTDGRNGRGKGPDSQNIRHNLSPLSSFHRAFAGATRIVGAKAVIALR